MITPRHAAQPARMRRGRPERSFRELFRSRDFTVLWLSNTQSQLGDQLARVALSVLVFETTRSALATAMSYALTYLPAVLGGVLLSGLADRWPRRRVLVAADAVRAVLFAVMALPHAPVWLVAVLVAWAVFVGAPYGAAAPAVVAELFTGDRYVAAQGFRTATSQTAQLLGFGVGGVVVAAIGARPALFVDALTFAIGALALRVWLTLRPAADAQIRSRWEQLRVGVRTVVGDRRLRLLLALAFLNAWWIVPEGLAAPYAAAHGGGPISVGVLLAAAPLGNIVGILVLTKWVPTPWRPTLLYVLAPVSGLPLIACGTHPAIPVAAVLWALSGVTTSYLVLIVTEYVAIVPNKVRGQAIGLASSGLLAAQGVGLIIAGALVAFWSPGTTIALAGAIGSACALPLALGWRRTAMVHDA